MIIADNTIRLGGRDQLGGMRVLNSPEVEPRYWEIEVTIAAPNTVYAFDLTAGTSIDLTVDYGDGSTANYTATGLKSKTYAEAGVYPVRFFGGAASELGIRLGQTAGTTPALVTNTKAVGGVSGFSAFSYIFYGTSISTLPANLFRYATSAIVFTGAFMNTAITSVPEGFFDFCPLTIGVSSIFRNCYSLINLPPLLFAKMPSCMSYGSAFDSASRVVMRDDLWGTNLQSFFGGKIANFASFLSRTPNALSYGGTAQALWTVTDWTPTTTNAFTGNNADSLTNWASIPSAWGGPA